MQLDLQKVRTMLLMAPLCSGEWIRGDGNGALYCAQGALLRGAGISQERIKELQETFLAEERPFEIREASDEEQAAHVKQVVAARDAAYGEMYRILEEEYGLPRNVAQHIPSFNDGSAVTPETRGAHVFECIVAEALSLGLTMGQDAPTLVHDHDSKTPSEEASQGGGLGRDLTDTAPTSHDADGSGEGGGRDTADGGQVGIRSDGEGLQPAALCFDPALALMGQASG